MLLLLVVVVVVFVVGGGGCVVRPCLHFECALSHFLFFLFVDALLLARALLLLLGWTPMTDAKEFGSAKAGVIEGKAVELAK